MSSAVGPIFTRSSAFHGPRRATVESPERSSTSIGSYGSPGPHSSSCSTRRTTGASRAASAVSSPRSAAAVGATAGTSAAANTSRRGPRCHVKRFSQPGWSGSGTDRSSPSDLGERPRRELSLDTFGYIAPRRERPEPTLLPSDGHDSAADPLLPKRPTSWSRSPDVSCVGRGAGGTTLARCAW